MNNKSKNFLRWQKLLYKTNILLAFSVMVIELVVSGIMYFQGLIEQTIEEYVIFYLVVPNIINWGLIIAMIMIVKIMQDSRFFMGTYGVDFNEKRDDSNGKEIKISEYLRSEMGINITLLLVLTGICAVVAYIHYVYHVTMLVFCVPICISLVFYSKRLSLITGLMSEICVIVIAFHRYERHLISGSDNFLLPETLISMMIIVINWLIVNAVVKLLLAQEKELNEAKEAAEVANNAKSAFLAKMSHEIRTPINAVIGMDEMILRESEEENILDYAVDINQAANALLNIINDILDLSKIESGKMEILPVEYDLSSLLHDVISVVTVRAKDKGLELRLDVDEKLPCRLFGDDIRIRQIITNLMTNAIKYTPKGSVTLKVYGRNVLNSLYLTVQIIDTGIGIKEEDIPLLAKQFQRLEESRNRNIEGTGLGMNITNQLLELMGSHLEVQSVYGQGSTFGFTIEQRIIDQNAIGSIEIRFKQASENYRKRMQTSFSAPTAKVLVVDDNQMNLKVFTQLLKHTKMRIDTATSGMQCLQMADQTKYDIIFLDHMMPDMDGIQTLQELKKLEECPSKDCPVVALTANAISGAKEMYLEAGFVSYLSKPIVPDKLNEVIMMLLPAGMAAPCTISGHESRSANKQSGVETAVTKLPEIDGMNWKYAMLILQDEDMLCNIALDFYHSLPENKADLVEKAANLEETGTMEAFRIRAHSLKSSAATVGALALSELAKMLEYAAKDRDAEQIRILMPYMEKMMDAYYLSLSVLE